MQIKETALKEAKNAAEAANNAKSAFLATISHEIRTPLNGIIGASELIDVSTLNIKQRDYINMIHSNGRSLLAIVNDILDLSKIEAGQQELEYITLSLRPMIESTLEMMRPNIQSDKVQLTSKIADSVPTYIHTDMQRLRQILSNLLSNAIKFTDQGAICLSVDVESCREGTTLLRFSVRDTGIGISEDNLQHLFKPFSQVDNSTTRRYGGTGLGLSICKQLISLMGGEISVKSRKGEGSEFYFTLPSRLEQDHYPVTIEPPAAHEKSPERPLKVLLAEDNQINQSLMLAMLQKLGYEATLAENGQEVMVLLERQYFDVILMDIHMPFMDGVEATRHIRRMPLKRQPYIIAFTADAFIDDRESYLASGMNDYLKKPVQITTLTEAISRAAASMDMTLGYECQ